MRFLSDENIATSVVLSLRHAGHDVFDVKEQVLFGASDAELARLAQRQRRIIITHDSDFLYQRRVPVILLRFHDQRPSNVSNRLLNFLNSTLSKKVRGIVIIT